MKYYFRVIPLTLFFLIITGHTLWAADHHVSTSEELDTALTTAQNNGQNDTILLSAGTYTGPFVYVADESEIYTLTIKPESGLTASQVVLNGVELETVLTIDTNEVSSATDDAAYHIHIHGMTFQNGCRGIWIDVEDGDVTISGNIIKNNIFGGCGKSGIYCSQKGTGNFILDKNIIQDNFTCTAQYCTVYSSTQDGRTTITNNLIQNNILGGIRIFNSTLRLLPDERIPIKIINNIIACNTGDFGLKAFGRLAELHLINNTICNNEGIGVDLYLMREACIANIYNNIIRDNESYDIFCDIADSHTHSIHYNAYNNNYHNLNGAWENHANNIDVNPKFISPATGNYHLQSNSPCIDTGNNGAPSLPVQDVEGDTRTYDGDENGSDVVDIGADEFVGPFPTCDGDFEPDGDVDGDDLADYIDNDMGIGLGSFAANFGTICP